MMFLSKMFRDGNKTNEQYKLGAEGLEQLKDRIEGEKVYIGHRDNPALVKEVGPSSMTVYFPMIGGIVVSEIVYGNGPVLYDADGRLITSFPRVPGSYPNVG